MCASDTQHKHPTLTSATQLQCVSYRPHACKALITLLFKREHFRLDWLATLFMLGFVDSTCGEIMFQRRESNHDAVIDAFYWAPMPPSSVYKDDSRKLLVVLLIAMSSFSIDIAMFAAMSSVKYYEPPPLDEYESTKHNRYGVREYRTALAVHSMWANYLAVLHSIAVQEHSLTSLSQQLKLSPRSAQVQHYSQPPQHTATVAQQPKHQFRTIWTTDSGRESLRTDSARADNWCTRRARLPVFVKLSNSSSGTLF
jgi:hypothetical protein